MVQLSRILARVPAIKFRKGLNATSSNTHADSTQAATGSAQAQSRQGPSAGPTISDIELPLRYQRRPLSQEEIDHINGGGVA